MEGKKNMEKVSAGLGGKFTWQFVQIVTAS
jgi:hypothetical protein